MHGNYIDIIYIAKNANQIITDTLYSQQIDQRCCNV